MDIYEAVRADKIKIEAEIVPVINYALQQNRINVIRNVKIINDSDIRIENVDLRIVSDSEICMPFEQHIEYIPENKSVELKNIKLTLNGAVLAAMTEKTSCVLSFSLLNNGEIIATKDIEAVILAFDEWHGLGMYPELLTAFVTPNNPEISKIIIRATEILNEWTNDPSMNAYQTQDPNRVINQAAAVWASIKEQNIVYAVHPASFEEQGQRVRLCDTVVREKLGTCLDLTLLYASCLEAIGLHPLLILTQGHIFTGLWLEGLSFSEAVQDDASLITKRLAPGINEIAVMETTMLTAGKNASFDDARAVAERELLGLDAVECTGILGDDNLSAIANLGCAKDVLLVHAQHMLASGQIDSSYR